MIGLQAIASGIAAILMRTHTAASKVLVLDCDNTLWGGVIGEDGLGGIVLGQDGAGRAYQDFQRAVKRLEQSGTLLALASKNSESDVWTAFDKHPGMILKRADIAASAIAWNDKGAGLARIAETLGLGLDSMVFWDDNPLEREAVRGAFPQVAVPEPPGDVSDWAAFLDARSRWFQRFSGTAEDRGKSAQYQARAEFVREQRGASSESEFLSSLTLCPTALALGASVLGRAEQLCAKTNQFNLRTQRHSAAELKRLSEDPNAVVFLAALKDRFGDHGIVGLVIARLDGETRSAPSRMTRCCC